MLAACACALALASPLAGAHFPGLTRPQAAWIRGLAVHAPPQGRRVLGLLAPRLSVPPGREEDLAGGDISYPELGADGRLSFVVSLAPRTLSGGRFGSHM